MKKQWSLVALAEVLTHNKEYIEEPEPKIYPKLSVKLYGRGVVLDDSADGSLLRMKKHQIAKNGQVILSEIWGKKGAIGFVPPEGDGALCTSHFFLFDVNYEKLEPKYLQAIFIANYLQNQLDAEAKGTTGYAAVRPKHLLSAKIPLPPLDEQRRIVARIEELAAKVEEARGLRRQIEKEINGTLFGAYQKIIDNVQWLSMEEVAPLERRSVDVKSSESYPELGVRSFGKGTFHKPALSGLEVGTKKLFRIEAGDLIFQIVFAWEGAVAVAQEKDKGRCGSHRFLTCVPKKEVVNSSFLYFHFLTTKGLQDLGEASPGGAGRNRTLGLKALGNIKVPVPPYEKLIWFDNLQAKVDALKRLQAETAAELDALLPSIIDKAFKGEL
jgi:type I restriction enzyme S subunit